MYDAKVYPVKAPNDSTVIIYGHDLGLTALWRGGRRIKAPPPAPAPTQKQQVNDVIMISDSEDENEEPVPDPTPKPDQYEEEEDELDPSRPFASILRSVDIPLGAKVLSLAVPNASPETAPSTRDTCPSILSNTIVVAAVCADASTRIVSLPIAPPAEDVSSDYQAITVGGGSVHSIPTSVAITFTSSNYQINNQSHIQRRQSSPTKRPESWEILLAIQSNEAIGTLSIYRIRLVKKDYNVYVFPQEEILPFQKQLLPYPARGLSFCPSQYPSEYHSWLLVTFPSGHVKVYSCLSSTSRKPGGDRRPSVSGDSQQLRGKWLLTLSTDFEPNSVSGRPKSIIDAKWILGGKAIIALLSDGEWGIWDLENASPVPASQANSINRPQTSFAVSGRVLASSQTKQSIQLPKATSLDSGPKFAPMTPSTRKVRENAFFKGAPTTSSTNDLSPLHTPTSARGGIALRRVNIPWDQPWDDAALIWCGDKTVQIGSLLSVWRNAVRSPSSTVAYDTSSRAKAVPLDKVEFYGQNQLGVGYVPNYQSVPSPTGTGRRDEPVTFDILLVAEYQLIIVALKTNVRKAAGFDERGLRAVDDEAKLRRGELDLGGVDRVLAGMAGGEQAGLGLGSGVRLFS